jgi:hypothetical protein
MAALANLKAEFHGILLVDTLKLLRVVIACGAFLDLVMEKAPMTGQELY